MQYTLTELIHRFPVLKSLENEIKSAHDALVQCYKSGNKILLCGNGGSAADAEHICGELMKGFLLPRELTNNQVGDFANAYGEEGLKLAKGLQQAIPAISLVSGVALPTAYANDMEPQNVFAQQVLGLGNKGDVLFAISTSGNSQNVINAMQVARVKGLKCIALTGKGGGKMAALCDILLDVPSSCTPEIQELHLPLYHTLCAMLEAEIFGISS